MLNTIGDLKDEFLIRIQGSTSVAFYTDTILNDWIDQAHKVAAGYKKWSMTEGRVSTTFTNTEEWEFEGYRPDSFRLVQVGGKRLQKLNFEDYQIFKEEQPSNNDRVFSDYGGVMFVNTASDISGTLTAFGQFVPVLDLTDTTSQTVFSKQAPEANEAIVEFMISFAKTREKKQNEALEHRKQAESILERVWRNYENEQFGYHTKDRGMFKRFDVLAGVENDELIKRDQF